MSLIQGEFEKNLKSQENLRKFISFKSQEIRKKNGFFSNNNNNSELASCDMDDLIHLLGPLTEDAVMKTLQARFNEKKYFVGFS